jgi:hypothetical protein
MKAKLLNFKENLDQIILKGLVGLLGVWVVFALGFSLYLLGVHFFGTYAQEQQIANEIAWKIDGTFKNDPNNIWYNADDQITIESVTNEVKIGKLAGNRKLEFGVKSILEEYLQDKGYNLSSSAPNKLSVQIIYLDVLTTKKNVSIFHSGEETVVIRLRGTLYKDGKKDKEVIVEESSSEISMSTLIVDEGGKFNQTSLSNALKKASDKLITKLLGEKK